MKKMNDKNIILISSQFFNYDIEIKKALEKTGANVYLYDDRPDNKTLTKAIIRLKPKLLKSKIHNYYRTIILENNGRKIDYILFVKCESALADDLQEFKKSFTDAKLYLYLWDSISNIKYFDEKKVFFDKILSFDIEDAKNDNDIIFRPLFYIDKYKADIKINHEYLYDLSFIGTAHSDRPKIINTIRKQLNKNGKTYYFKLYIPSRIILIVKYLLNSDVRDLYKNGHIITEKIDSNEIEQIIKMSNSIIDIEHPKQTGLTMRTIELIGMNKKIITTNKHIKEYNFYNDKNIFLLDRSNPVIDLKFLELKYNFIKQNIYDYYSIHTWIKDIFNERN